MYEDTYSNELHHHGIKGMRWGIRRFQKKDGTLTTAGKKRYSDDDSSQQTNTKSKHRLRLEANYKAKGLSAKEAEKAANKRIKIEKTLAITAGVTVGACAAYYARNKWIADRTDQVLKAGTSFHNLDRTANPRPGEHLYVNYRQNDRNFFNGEFAVNKMRRSGHVFEHRIEAIDDVKIPSLKTRQSVFKQLCESDPDFKEAMRKHSGMPVGTSSKGIYKNMWQKFGDKDTPYFNEAKAKYFKALKEKGYAAVVDEWDTRASVYRSDAPLILLDTNHKSLGKMTIRELKANDVAVAQANSHNYTFKNGLLNAISAPHTNHFKESDKSLSKYYKLNAKNQSYVDTAILKGKYQNGAFNKTDIGIKDIATKHKGKQLAYAGKYLSENKDMTYTEAMAKAKAKYNARQTAEGAALLTVSTIGTYAPFAALTTAANSKQINDYRSKHPNSNMTDKEILKMLNNK